MRDCSHRGNSTFVRASSRTNGSAARIAWWKLVKIAIIVACFPGRPAMAAWNTQAVTLQPGWNAVFLEVQPEPDAVDQVFEGLPVRSVWMWNRRFSPVQFV